MYLTHMTIEEYMIALYPSSIALPVTSAVSQNSFQIKTGDTKVSNSP